MKTRNHTPLNARRLIITKLGNTFANCTELEDFQVPAPGVGELLVRNHFAGINGIYDQMMCYDRIDHTHTRIPSTCGVEAVGVVEAVGGEVSEFSVGDCVSTVKVGNGYTTHHTIAATEAWTIPAAEARYVCLNPSGVSALLALERVGELQTSDVVCISAAAGGLGNMMTQVAIANGNHVVALCGDDKKADWLTGLGAHRVIRYRQESAAEVLSGEYKDSLDVAMDSVGGSVFDAMLDNLAPHGRLVICGFTSDRLPTEKVIDERIYTRLYWKAASVRGYMNYRFAEYFGPALEKLIEMTTQGAIKPLVHTPMLNGLESVAEGVELLLAGKTMGKAVVDLRKEL
ncbi:MAG: zinc-binding dehydrogenase [Pseudomonadota bacterium]